MKFRRIVTLVQEFEYTVTPDHFEGAVTPSEVAKKEQEWCMEDPMYFLEGDITDYSVIVRVEE